MMLKKIADEISISAQLASLIEVSGYPKPGNVDRLHNFKDTKYEHFLASGAAIGPVIREVALRTMYVINHKMGFSKIVIGEHIRRYVIEARRWHRGGNTNLGMAALLVPLASGAATAKISSNQIDVKLLQKYIKKILQSTTVEDAIAYYKAVRSANFGWLGKIKATVAPDALSKKAFDKLRSRKISLYKVMEECSSWDGIGAEWTSGMHMTFDVGYPAIVEAFNRTSDLNAATVQCYLVILSRNPDSLIARKNGVKIALKISKKAEEIIASGGVFKASEDIMRFDEELRRHDNTLNPGTTADLTASSLMVAILTGIVP